MAKKKSSKRKGGSGGGIVARIKREWKDKAILAGGLATLTAVAVGAERYRTGQSLNPFTKSYWLGEEAA